MTDIDTMRAERDAAIAARDEAVIRLDELQRVAVDVYEQRIREIADDVLGVTPSHTPTVVLLGAIEQKHNDERIGRLAAERARDEVGIQLAAAQERLRLAMTCVNAADDLERKTPGDERTRVYAEEYRAARRALDTVPGDALPPSPAGTSGLRARVAELEGLLREAQDSVTRLDFRDAITRALEASGIDTNNVKDGEG